MNEMTEHHIARLENENQRLQESLNIELEISHAVRKWLRDAGVTVCITYECRGADKPGWFVKYPGGQTAQVYDRIGAAYREAIAIAYAEMTVAEFIEPDADPTST